MKRYAIIHINIVIFLALALGIVFYANAQTKNSRRLAEENLTGTTEVISGIAGNYFTETENVCVTWATYINNSDLTMEEAIEYLGSVRISDDVYAQIIWADDLTGLSREAYLADEGRFDVSYANREYLFRGWSDRTKLFVTPRFTNPVTGSYSIAFCEWVFLKENGKLRQAIVMRIVPSSYLESRWVFPSNYENASIAIIDMSGSYVLKPDSMKNEDFYSYLYSYNRGSIDQKALEDKLRNEKSGIVTAKNAMGTECLWSFRHIDANNEWIVVMSVPASDIKGDTYDWAIPIAILLTLLLVFTIDMLHFVNVRRRDLEVNEKLKKQGDELKAALESAEYANRAKTTFLNHMSHDIRTPMNAIIGYTKIALKEETTPEVRDCLTKIDESSEHLLTLINDVLDISRIESGRVEYNPQPVDIRSITDTVLSIAEGYMNDRDIKFEVYRDPLDYPYVMADAVRIRDILVNILSNAVKFTPDGGKIKFEAIWEPAEDDKHATVIYKIADTGAGMSREFLEHAFEEFAQEESGARTKYKGTGLGLAISKRYAELMNGTITVESEKGKGTEFTVTIPFELAQIEESLDKPAKAAKADLNGIKVLLVEDNDLNAEIATVLLDEAGMLVTRVCDGEEAVEAFNSNPKNTYELILMDIMMPRLNGYDATRKIRSLDREDAGIIPIVAMTVNAFAEDVEAARKAGMNGHVAKPIDIARLMSVLAEVLHTPN
ncbi:MAG: ATP-binding protein [Eubacteriales bacterium]|nr:ATP-binding protein [Eubacteriales bacterium]